MPDTGSLAVHIGLEWSDLPYQVHVLPPGAQHEVDYLSINPLGSVPAMVLEDGRILTETAALLLYLDAMASDVFNAPPKTHYDQADLASQLSFLSSELHGAFGPHFVPQRYSPDPDHYQDLKDQADARIAFLLRHMEEQFNGPYLLGEHPSVADPYLFVICRWVGQTTIDLENYPQLASFKRHMSLDSGVAKVVATYRQAQ